MLLTGKYLFSKVQELGLQAAYTSDDGVHRYIKKLMALPFLPRREIRPMFQLLRRQAETQPLQDMVSYINNQLIESTVSPPKNWSVYLQRVRTNNDLEGWHNALNRRANGQSGWPLYYLIELLEREARLTTIAIRLVSDQKLSRVDASVTVTFKGSCLNSGIKLTIARYLQKTC